ncbi:MAG: hypothetical protein HY819_14470 [Acidobacteria bacterium]|nr:hypothetical protein [Acidobacteriota bacterium]
MSEQRIEVSESLQILDNNSIAVSESIQPSGLTRPNEKEVTMANIPRPEKIEIDPISTNGSYLSNISPSGEGGSCGCGGSTPPSLVYALGHIGFDFGTEARRDSLLEKPNEEGIISVAELLANFENNPSDAASVIWTLNLDSTPIYAIRPFGPFAAIGYQYLMEFLKAQGEDGTERVSIPGIVSGKVSLINGHTVPVLFPDVRGMYSWSTATLIKSLIGEISENEEERARQFNKTQAIINFLRRIYHEARNLGLSSQERAINHAATNAFQLNNIYISAINAEMSLDTIDVEANSTCRPGRDCWDVKLIFFNPNSRFEQARRVYRFTIDVSDIIPVVVGEVRDWYVDNDLVSMSGAIEPSGLTKLNQSSVIKQEATLVDNFQLQTVEKQSFLSNPYINSIFPSGGNGDCKCSNGSKSNNSNGISSSLVYALGQIGYDFGTEARRDSFVQQTDGGEVDLPEVLLAHLENNPSDATDVIWTLNSDDIPIYAIQPFGSFADVGYQRLREFLKEQKEEEQISIPGVVSGKVTLLNGYTLPVIHPEVRGMYAWSINTLTEKSRSRAEETRKRGNWDETKSKAVADRIDGGLGNFLARVYYEIRNLGLSPQERAINYAATRAFQLDTVYSSAINKSLDLQSIDVEPSPICRPSGDCWDVKLIFFDPSGNNQARRMYRFTIDVSDIVPVKIGKMRTWTM